MGHFPIIGPLLVPGHHVSDAAGVVAILGDGCETGLEQLRGIRLKEGLGGESSHEHLAVDAVGMERDFGIDAPVLRSRCGIAGQHEAPELALHLPAHELAKVVLARLGRPDALLQELLGDPDRPSAVLSLEHRERR